MREVKKKAGRPPAKKRKKGEERKVYTFTLDPLLPGDKMLMDYLESNKITDSVKKGLQLLIKCPFPEGEGVLAQEQLRIEEQMKQMEAKILERVLERLAESGQSDVGPEQLSAAKENEDDQEIVSIPGLGNLPLARE